MTDLIRKVKGAATNDETAAADAALCQHADIYGNTRTRKLIYRVKVAGKVHQIEVVSAKKYMIAEVRNCHRRLNKIHEGVRCDG